MKYKLVLIQCIGALFFVKAFNLIGLIIFDAGSLEVFRTESSFSFYSGLTEVSQHLQIISFTGLIGLLIAISISFYINKQMKYSQLLLMLSFLLVLILNKLFVDITEAIHFKSKYLEIIPVKHLLISGFIVSTFIGFCILLSARYLEKLNYYFKLK